jgi:hypothetical protein
MNEYRICDCAASTGFVWFHSLDCPVYLFICNVLESPLWWWVPIPDRGRVRFGLVCGKKVSYRSQPLSVLSAASLSTCFIVGSLTCRVGILVLPASVGSTIITSGNLLLVLSFPRVDGHFPGTLSCPGVPCDALGQPGS